MMDRLQTILSLLDLTTLEGSDNQGKISSLCKKALSFGHMGLPYPAAVCVYPVFVRQARQDLGTSGIRVASVAGAFPSGQSPLPIRIAEVKFAVDEGADEIDMVISRGRLMEGDVTFVHDEIAAIKDACGTAHLKVILETGELKTPELIKQASETAIAAGADFIKTSTGKIQPAATVEAAAVMLEVIADHYIKTGKKIGFKPAGGISDVPSAQIYFELVRNIAGEEWLNPELFRIGASRLADALLLEIQQQKNK